MTDNPEWRDSLPEEIQNAPYFRPTDDGSPRTTEQIVADLTNAARLQGNLAESHIKIFNQDASDEDVQRFRERVLKADPGLILKPEGYSAVPDSADGYQAPQIEGFDAEAANLGAVRDMAAANKWTQAQFDGYLHQLAGEQRAGQENLTLWRNQQTAAINDQWGAAAGERIELAARAAEKMGSAEMAGKIRAGEVDAHVVLTIGNLAQQMRQMGGEQAQFHDQQGGRSGLMTPDEARAKADELGMKMLEMRPGDPQYQNMMIKRLEYMKMATSTAA